MASSVVPPNFIYLNADGGGKTIRALATAAKVSYLTPYYQVLKKETVPEDKDVIAVSTNAFRRGADARTHLGLPATGTATILPGDIPAGTKVYIQSSSNARKIPIGAQALLQIAEDGTVPAPAATQAPVPAPTPAAATATAAAAGANTKDNNPRPNKKARKKAEEKKNDNQEGGDENVVEDDDTALGPEVLHLRLRRAGARSCNALQASLIWNDIADLDISCTTPDGTLIYYGNQESECGGWLDVDMNVDVRKASAEPVVNMFWPSAPSGKYVFRVTNYNCHVDPNRPKFADRNRSVPFRLYLTKNGKKEVVSGSLKDNETKVCFEFELEGEGAFGSYVVMPPSDKSMIMKEACENHGVTYNMGMGYYSVSRVESISQYRALLLQNIEKDTFTIGGEACRKQLDWPTDEKMIRKGPKDLPEGYRLFLQSTTHNRKIQSGNHFLMKVSVKEALQHRPVHNTRCSTETDAMGTSLA